MSYEFHGDLTTPRRSTVLWRYMDFAKFVEMLESGTLWLVRVDQLEDPLEGTHTDAELARIRRNVEPERAQRLIDVFRTARSEVYVNCWHSGSTESLAMWDLYGKGSGIVAVKSTVGRLRQAVATCDMPVFISKVKYIDWNDHPGIDNVLVACSRKDLSHRHESEVRAMVLAPYSGASDHVGIRVSVDLKRMLTGVIVGPREPAWIVRLVEQLMKEHGLPQAVTASDRLTARR